MRTDRGTKHTGAFKKLDWHTDEYLDKLMGEWRRHVIGTHRITITASAHPHVIDNCDECQDYCYDWEAILEYTTGI